MYSTGCRRNSSLPQVEEHLLTLGVVYLEVAKAKAYATYKL